MTKQLTITINGVEKVVYDSSLDYHAIVDLAFGQPMKSLQTITYFARVSEHMTRHGEVVPFGPSINITDGMSINCGNTGNA